MGLKEDIMQQSSVLSKCLPRQLSVPHIKPRAQSESRSQSPSPKVHGQFELQQESPPSHTDLRRLLGLAQLELEVEFEVSQTRVLVQSSLVEQGPSPVSQGYSGQQGAPSAQTDLRRLLGLAQLELEVELEVSQTRLLVQSSLVEQGPSPVSQGYSGQQGAPSAQTDLR